MSIDVVRDTWTSVHPDCIYEGRIYGMPVNASANGMWYHKDLLRAAGVTVPSAPWTWDQFLEIAKKLTIRDEHGRVTQYGMLMDWENNYRLFMLQWGGHMYTPDGTRCVIDSPQCIDALQFMHDLVYVHGVCPRPIDESAMATSGGWGGGRGTSITFFGG